MLISASELLKQSWEVYFQNWKKIIPFMLMFFLPTAVISALGVLFMFLSVYAPYTNLTTDLILLAVFAASIVFALWLSIAFTKELKNILTNQPTNGWRAELASSTLLIWPAILGTILVALLVVGGTILLIVPGIIYSIWYSFVFYSIVLDEKKGLSALNASKSLVVGRWWAIFWRIFAPGLLIALIGGLISSGLVALISAGGFSPLWESVLLRLSTSVINVLISPLSALITLILYLSAKQNPVEQKIK